jgi:hypothetical protein
VPEQTTEACLPLRLGEVAGAARTAVPRARRVSVVNCMVFVVWVDWEWLLGLLKVALLCRVDE